MNEQKKWNYINTLEDELLLGGVILSEWSTFLAKDAELAFCSGANLAAILAAQAAIESHLRYEYFDTVQTKGWGLYRLLENTRLPVDLKNSLHKLRQFRNRWVHVEDPTQDDHLLKKPEYYEEELEKMAKLAIKSMLRVLSMEQWV